MARWRPTSVLDDCLDIRPLTPLKDSGRRLQKGLDIAEYTHHDNTMFLTRWRWSHELPTTSGTCSRAAVPTGISEPLSN